MTNEQLHAFLTSLGSTADEVAATLKKADAKGERWDATACPVSSAVWRELRRVNPELKPKRIVAGSQKVFVSGICSCATPEPVRDFQNGFDHGDWPELVA